MSRRTASIARTARWAVPLALIAAVLLPAQSASARKVGNPGAASATIPGGSFRIKTSEFDLASIDPDPQLTGTIDAQGNVNIPQSGIVIPPLSLDVNGDQITVRLQPTQPWTGTINPLTGAGSIRARFRIKLEGSPQGISLGGSCYIGDSNNIDINTATTGTTSPPGPNTPISGTPYTASTGQTTLVNNSYSVPGAEGCGPFGLANGPINDALGLPSAAGNNELRLNLQFSPAITKGINASFTASPASGPAPLSSSLNASATFMPDGVRTCTPALPTTPNCGYRWDYDNNNTVDEVTNTPTVNHVYATPGTYTTRLTVFDSSGGGQDSDTTTRTVTVGLPLPDLTIDKSHVGNFTVGQPASYSLKVDNLSTGPTTGPITVTDNLPAGLTFVSGTGTNWSCSAVGQLVTCTRSTAISGGASSTIALNVTPGGAATPSVTNTATVTTVGDTGAGNNSDTDPTTVVGADLGIVKSHSGTFGVGREEAYTLTVTNNGPVATSGVATVTDTLPAGLTFVSATGDGWSCSNSGQTVTCTRPAGIPASNVSAITLAVAVGPSAVPSVTNTATVATEGDPVPGNNSSSDPTTVVNTPDLAIDKFHTGAFRVGGTGTYTIAVRNGGARATVGTTTVSDTLPAGLTPLTATGTDWTCNIAGQAVTCTNTSSISPNTNYAPITLTASVAQSAFPSVTNTATVSNTGTGDDADPNPANDTDSDPTAITAVDLTIDKSHVGGFAVGEEGSFNLSVSNAGSAPTAGLTTITDTLPAELTYVSATGTGWSCGASGQVVTCTRSATIAAGATANAVTLVVAVDPDTTDVETTNVASVSTVDDVNPANDSDSDTAPLTATDLSLDKSHGAADFRVGTTRAYRLRIENVGSQPTQGTTTVTDTLPGGLTYVDGTGSGWSCGATGQDVTCERTAAIASGASAPAITLRASVAPEAHPGVTNSATVANSADRNSANDTDVDPTTVVASDLAIDKSHTGNLRVGARAAYSLAVTNVGEVSTSSPATVTDTLPGGLTYAGSPSPDWDCSAAAQVVTCTHDDSIAAASSAGPLEIRADVGPSAAGTVTNEATVAVAGDPDASNDSDSDPATVERVDLTIDKSHTGSFTRGGEGVYTLDVSNTGDTATSGPTRITDALPAGLSHISATGTGWSCSLSSGTVTCTQAASIGAGADAEPVTLTTRVAGNAPAFISNTATVFNAGDGNGANDSDTDPATVAPAPDAAISIRPQLPAGGSFRAGTPGTYTVAVRNVSTEPISGTVSVGVTLPAGSSYLDSTASGWSCSASGPAVSCARASGLAAGARSDIGLEVAFTKAAGASVTTSATVDAPGDNVAGNDSGSDTSSLKWIDLAIAMSSSGSFAVDGSGAFSINVSNPGTATTIGPQTITDVLPAGLAYSAATGTGWSCSASGQTVTCTRAAPLGPGAAAPAITLNVTPSASAGSQTLSNTATVATPDDADAANDSDTEQVTVGPAPQVQAPPDTTPQTPSTTPPAATTPATKCKKSKKKGKSKKKKKCGKRKKK